MSDIFAFLCLSSQTLCFNLLFFSQKFIIDFFTLLASRHPDLLRSNNFSFKLSLLDLFWLNSYLSVRLDPANKTFSVVPLTIFLFWFNSNEPSYWVFFWSPFWFTSRSEFFYFFVLSVKLRQLSLALEKTIKKSIKKNTGSKDIAIFFKSYITQ